MMKRLLQQVKESRTLLVWAVLLGCLGGLVLIVESYYIARIVNDVFMQGLSWLQVKRLIIVLLVVIVTRAIVQMVSEYTAAKLAQRIKSELRIRLIDKLGRLGPQYAKEERSGEVASTLYEGVEQLENYLSKYVPQIALSMFIPFAIFIVVFQLDLLSVLVYAITLPLLVIFMILIGKYTKFRTDKQYKLLGRLGGHFQEILRGMETLKLFNRSKEQYDTIATISEEHRKSTMATLRLAFLSAFVMELFATLSTAMVAVFLGFRLIEGNMQFYDAFLILLLTPEFYSPIRALGTQFHSGMNGASAATRIFEILDAEEKGVVSDINSKSWSDVCSNDSSIQIQFNDVVVSHEGYEQNALQRINFTLQPGQKLAIVGPTGAGKSTILDVLQGFIKPSMGKVIINGTPLAEINIHEWREQIAVVSQHTHLFHGTIKENIVGLSPELYGDDEVWDALRWAGADLFVSQLPNQLYTVISDQIQLSGGQIQRLALARAYFKREAQLVLLDEPTSALDNHYAEYLTDQLVSFLTHKSAIIVTHQLELIKDADYIIVVEEGQITEHGQPNKLAEQDSLFRKMLKANEHLEVHRADHESIRQTYTNSQTRYDDSTTRLAQGASGIVSSTSQVISSSPSMSLRDMCRQFRRLLSFFGQYKGMVVLAILLSFFTIAANIGLMGTSGYLIAKSALRPENILMVYIPVVGVRFFGISRAIFRYLERLAAHNVTFKALHQLRLWLYESIEPRGTVLLKQMSGGQLLGAIISHIEQLQYFFLRIFSPLVVYVLVLIGSVTFMAFIHSTLAIALAIMLLMAGIVIPYSSYKASVSYTKPMIRLRLALYEGTLDLLRGSATLQQFGWMKVHKQNIASTQTALNASQQKEHWQLSFHNGLMTLTTQLGMWLVLILSIPLITDGIVSAYMLPAIVLMTLASFEGAALLPQAYLSSRSIAASAEHLFQVADGKGEWLPHEAVVPFREYVSEKHAEETDASTDMSWECRLEKVSFQYEETSRLALQHIDLHLQKGKRVAVVGESGAGKSSLIQVLTKLRPICAGSYTLNGVNVSHYEEEQVREHFSVVSQHVQLFNATVLQNLRLGDKAASLEQIRDAAKIAEIDDFIMSLPNGYNTMLGEYGATLSGGQRQRLALARALVQGHAALLLDEPATGLDTLTEHAFLTNLSTIEKNYAVLWVTHRLSQIINMDEIVVMEMGRIVERGTHEELLQRQGAYYKLWCLERAKDWQTII